MRTPAVLTFRSIFRGRAEDVFEWHERPEALPALAPSRRFVRIEEQTGGLRDGGRVTLSIGAGPFRMRWEARHYGYIAGRQFCDEQVRGPFKVWRHAHRFEPYGAGKTLYEDRVEYVVPGGRVVQRLAEFVVRPLLVRMFRTRHRTVRRHVTPLPK